MEKISGLTKKLFDFSREPGADEYLKDGLIYCKNCNTPRQVWHEYDGEKTVFNTLCDCREKQRAAEEKAERERKHRETVETLRHRGIPNPAYRTYTFETDDGGTPGLTQICKAYVAKFGEMAADGLGLLLWGDVGTGKTFYALAIANALIEKELRVCCTSLAAVVQLAQDFDNAEDHFKRLMRQDLIVIDDLGTERCTKFAAEQIHKFIDGCNTHGIPLIITTNLMPSELQAAAEMKQLPDGGGRDVADPATFARIYSRILEKCLPVKINEIKRRTNNAQANRDKIAQLLGVK